MPPPLLPLALALLAAVPPGAQQGPRGDERSRLHCQSALQPDGAAADLAVDPPLPRSALV
ncbi:unnamed protein product [Lepidochelys kempii]